MACGTPCIATDVGDAAFIIGKTGWVVPPKNPIKLSRAIENALLEFGSKKWDNKCVKSRLTIKEKFSINKMLNSYNKVWRKVYKQNY
jgi:glycosyltransferase involved in cell wall biosynthesis